MSALLAIVGGGSFVLFGVDGVAIAVGTEYPNLVPELQKAAASIDSAAKVTFDTWYRALGWYWLSTGLMLLWIIPNIESQGPWFRFVHIGFMAVGVANSVTILDSGLNVHSRYGAVVIELAVPLAFIGWQWSLSRTMPERQPAA